MSPVLPWLCSCWLDTAASQGLLSPPGALALAPGSGKGFAELGEASSVLLCLPSLQDHLTDEVIGSFSPSGGAS